MLITKIRSEKLKKASGSHRENRNHTPGNGTRNQQQNTQSVDHPKQNFGAPSNNCSDTEKEMSPLQQWLSQDPQDDPWHGIDAVYGTYQGMETAAEKGMCSSNAAYVGSDGPHEREGEGNL